MDTVVFTDSLAIDFFANEVVLGKFNAEVDSNLAKQYSISGYPTCVLTDMDGNEIDRIVGYLPTEELLQTIRDYSNGIGTLDDLLRRAETEQDRNLYFEIADKYKYRGGSQDANLWYQKVITAGEPLDSLSGECRISIADMHRRDKDYDRALEEFGKIAAEFTGTSFGQDADIYVAIVHRGAGDTAKAIDAFQAYIDKYPESEDLEYAQKQIERLKNPEKEGS